MPLNDFAPFIDQKLSLTGGAAPEPSPRAPTAGAFRGLQRALGVGMRNSSANVFTLRHGPARQEARLIILSGPDVVRNLRNGRSNNNGFLLIHSPKGKSHLCNTAAEAIILRKISKFASIKH